MATDEAMSISSRIINQVSPEFVFRSIVFCLKNGQDHRSTKEGGEVKVRFGQTLKDELKKLLKARKSDSDRVVLFEDETGFSLHPKLGRIGERGGRGLTSTPKASTINVSISLAGSILSTASMES